MIHKAEPIITDNISTIKYPSCLFSLERNEIAPYERFSYNILYNSLTTLPKKTLPVEIEVDFNENNLFSPWSINASINITYTSLGLAKSYKYCIPQLLPAMCYIFTIIIGKYIFEDKRITKENAKSELVSRVQYYVDGISSGVRIYKEKGLGFAIRTCYDYFNLKIEEFDEYFDAFDLLSKYISLHEIAHAYTLEKKADTKDLKPIDQCAYEMIADLLAATWLFTIFVYCTPDTAEYRTMRNISTFSECIKSNSISCINTLHSSLILSSLAGAQQNSGKLTLDGGIRHPNGLSRYIFSCIHILGLIHSYYEEVLSEKQFYEIDDDYKHNTTIIIESGIINKSDADMLLSISEKENIERVIELISEKNIQELEDYIPFLRSYLEN